jgi:hypothetical protein
MKGGEAARLDPSFTCIRSFYFDLRLNDPKFSTSELVPN